MIIDSVIYRMQENFGGKNFGEFGKSWAICQGFFANFHNRFKASIE